MQSQLSQSIASWDYVATTIWTGGSKSSPQSRSHPAMDGATRRLRIRLASNESVGERRAGPSSTQIIFFSRRILIPRREPHMVNIPALGGSPVAFTDVNGNQREIPLSQLFFDSHGINASNWPPYY